MTNKEMMEKLFHQKLNKHKNYDCILQRLEDKPQATFHYRKWAAAVICVLLFGTVFIIYRSNPNPVDSLDQELIYMNEVIQPENYAKIDAIQSKITMNDKGCRIENFDSNTFKAEVSSDIECFELGKLKIPEDLAAFEANYVLYMKNQKIDNYFPQYQKTYRNDSNRSIIIHYTKGNTLYHDYDFKDGKASFINKQELFIYHYENSYWVQLTHNQMQIVVEATDIHEEELITLLRSIVE